MTYLLVFIFATVYQPDWIFKSNYEELYLLFHEGEMRFVSDPYSESESFSFFVISDSIYSQVDRGHITPSNVLLLEKGHFKRLSKNREEHFKTRFHLRMRLFDKIERLVQEEFSETYDRVRLGKIFAEPVQGTDFNIIKIRAVCRYYDSLNINRGFDLNLEGVVKFDRILLKIIRD